VSKKYIKIISKNAQGVWVEYSNEILEIVEKDEEFKKKIPKG
jgi:hypothetical protein